jgi:hypothetical protein
VEVLLVIGLVALGNVDWSKYAKRAE